MSKSLSDDLLESALRSPQRSQIQRDTAIAAGVIRVMLEVTADILQRNGLSQEQADALKLEILQEYTRRVK